MVEGGGGEDHRPLFPTTVCDNVMNIKQYPDTVTIRTPMYSPVPRGPQAARGPYGLGPLGSNLRVRVNRVDMDMIKSVADALGMKPAAFVRWCCVEVAKELTRHDKQRDATDGSSD